MSKLQRRAGRPANSQARTPALLCQKNPPNRSRRRQSAHYSSVREVSADCRRRLRLLESALGPGEWFRIRAGFLPPGGFDFGEVIQRMYS